MSPYEHDDTPLSERLLEKPYSLVGWLSLALAVLSLGVLGLATVVDGSTVGTAVLATSAGCAILSGILSAIAIWREQERCLFLFITLVLGSLVLVLSAMTVVRSYVNR